ncbi:hypothetical protein SAMN05444722_2838 [Rhodovulum sp. ES.010]|uniref:invasion associated locus B family protein n=1 Tax=Rhodovulum sp. ES.010 TaxID=1882821 RepID=UPI00092A2285|nr:invasion associated locus B family protein [Rhodovulum sp. ES.010]SIO50665.1 hypothetical protein SAMN05444722_2838 [Rhodovulum sp. ES.010]
MTSPIRTALLGGVMALAGWGAQAQEESTNNVAVKTDWNVFVESDPTECWGVSPPKETVNSRDGRVVEVRRGEILLFVSFRPGSGVAGEVSFRGGYPFADGSTVKVEIGDSAFELFTQNVEESGEMTGYAWPASKEDDARLLAAMKRGAEAVVTGVSSRGTTTKDTFSLMGFTAAMDEAEQRCGGN